jgi:glycosyltransferase involved in cell wall biosynthesis
MNQPFSAAPSPGEPRILWITERYPPDPGGMAVSCERKVKGLRSNNLALDVLAFTENPAIGKVREEDRDGGTDWFLPRAANPGTIAELGFVLVRGRHQRRPYSHVVGFGAGLSGFIAVTYAAWLGLPSLVLVRGNDFDRDWFDPRRGYWVREALARATVIGTVSIEMAERVRALFPGRDVRWTVNGVDAGRWELIGSDRARRDRARAELGDNGRRIVGVFGELKYKKRVPLFLAALRDTGLMDKVGLLAVGRLDEETTQILADPALAPKNHHVSFSPREELAGLYAACDYVALPSLFEGMPNVLLEAMAAGAVPIASTAGAMPEMVEDGVTGFLFPAEDRDRAAEAIGRALALTDDELAAMAGRASQSVRERFSVERELRELREILLGGGA